MNELRCQLERERTCYEYTKEMSEQFYRLGNKEKALAYLENATRSLREVNRLEKAINQRAALNEHGSLSFEEIMKVVDMYG